MDFFDDIGKTFTSVATEIFHGVDNATTVIFDANKQALSQLGVDKDSFTNKVLDQWQEKKRVAVGVYTSQTLLLESTAFRAQCMGSNAFALKYAPDWAPRQPSIIKQTR